MYLSILFLTCETICFPTYKWKKGDKNGPESCRVDSSTSYLMETWRAKHICLENTDGNCGKDQRTYE